MASTSNIKLFCLVDGEFASRVFPVKVSADDSFSDLKKLIKVEKSPEFDDIAADKLTLWHVSIPVVAADMNSPIVLSKIDSKTELLPTDGLSDVIKGTPPKKTIHILVERPTTPTTPTAATKYDPVISFTVTLEGRIPMTFPWWTDITTATLDGLRGRIYAKEDSLNDGLQAIMVYESDVNTACYSYIETDDGLRRWLRIRADRNLLDFSIRLEGPPRPFSDVTTAYADRIYNSDTHLPIGKAPSTTTDRTQALNDLFVSLRAAVKAAPPANKSGYSLYINAFLVHAVGLFPELRLSFDQPVSGRRGYGSIPCAVQSKADPSCMLPVTVTGSRHIPDIEDGIAHNKVQLDVISSSRKRKFEDDTDDTDDTGDTDRTAPAKSYGIVTNAEMWNFLQCTIDTLHDTGYNDPVYNCFTPTTTIHYYFSHTEQWEAEVKTIFEHLVWQLQKMVDDHSPKNKRFKPQ